MGRESENSSELPQLGPLEAQVLDVIWDHGPITTKEIIARLSGVPAYTTIATVLANLRRKGLVSSTRQGRSALFSSRVTRPERAAQLIERVLAESGERSASMLHFVESMSDADLELLRDYLRRRDGQEGVS